MPKILESEALVLANSIDAAAPEDRPWMLDVLTRYQSQQFDNGDPEWPTQAKQQAEAETRFRSMFDAPEKVPYDPGPYAKDPNAERASYANAAFIANRYNVEFGEAVDRRRFYMDDYAAKKGQKSGLDDMAFYNLAKGEVAETKLAEDTRLEGAKAALRGEDGVRALSEWQIKNPDKNYAQFTQGFLKAQETAGDYLDIADELFSAMEVQAGMSKDGKAPTLRGSRADAKFAEYDKATGFFSQGNDKSTMSDVMARNVMSDIVDEMADMKPREQKAVFQIINAKIEAAGYDQKGFWAQAMSGLDRGFGRLPSTITGASETVLGKIGSVLAVGEEPPAELVAGLEEADRKRAARGEVIDRISDVIGGKLDPVTATVGFLPDSLEKGMIRAPGAVLPFMAISATTGFWTGFGLMSLDFAEQTRRDLRAGGMDNAQAENIGLVAAPFLAGVEQLSNWMQLGRFPGVQRALANFAKPITGKGVQGAVRYGQNFLASLGVEMSEETLQNNLIVPAIQNIAAKFDEAIPGVGLGAIWDNIKRDTPDTFWTILPAALVFGGSMTMQQAELSDAATADRDLLMELGFSASQANETASKPTVEERVQTARSLWGVRAGTPITMGAAAKNLSERMRQLQGDAVAQQQELERRGKLPIMRPIGDRGQWTVFMRDGSNATFDTIQEAQKARWDWTADQLGTLHKATRETLNSMERNLPTGRELTVEISPDARFATPEEMANKDFQDRIEQGKVLDGLQDAVAIDAAMSGDSVDAVKILGTSNNEMLDGVLRTTIRLYEGANILTLVEEKLEGDIKVILSDAEKRGTMIDRLREYEALSGDSIFADGITDDNLTTKMIVEAWSHLGQSYLVGRSTFGEPLQAKTMRRFGKFLMGAKLMGAMNAEAAFFEAVVGRAKKLGELQKAGKLGADLTAELEKQLGIDSQLAHEAGAEAEARQLIDTSGYSEETPGPNGETFSISSKELRVKIEVSPDSTTLGNLGITEGFHANHGGEVVPDFAPRASKQGRKGQYAGFYLGPAINEVSQYGQNVSTFPLNPNTPVKVLRRPGQVERITPEMAAAWRAEGFSVVVGPAIIPSKIEIATLSANVLNTPGPNGETFALAPLAMFTTKEQRDYAFGDGRYTHPVTLKNGTRLSGETFDFKWSDTDKMPTFFGYTKSGAEITIQAQYVTPDMVATSRDSGKSANDLRDRLEKWHARRGTNGETFSLAVLRRGGFPWKQGDRLSLKGQVEADIYDVQPNKEGSGYWVVFENVTNGQESKKPFAQLFDSREDGLSLVYRGDANAIHRERPELDYLKQAERPASQKSPLQVREKEPSDFKYQASHQQGAKVGSLKVGDWIDLDGPRQITGINDEGGSSLWLQFGNNEVLFERSSRLDRVRATPADASKVVQMPDGARLVGPTTFSIRAFHGTPHKVDKFSLDKIGTGEGAQAYGWGLYFAESEGVADQYRKSLSGRAMIRSRVNGWEVVNELDGKLIGLFQDRAEADAAAEKYNIAPGNLYTVELLPDESEFLDWDKPLSEQSEKVKAALALELENAPESVFEGGVMVYPKKQLQEARSGEDFYFRLGNNQDASERLASLGIPGIRFLDGNSRGAGEGTYNYVIFDENLIRILEENGKPVGETFSLRASDAEYMAAVEAGDMETAQRMVDEAAKAAGFETKAWHGSPDDEFTVFQKLKKEADEDGFWFSKDREWASKFGPTRLFYIKDIKTWGGDDFVVKNPNSIKSADPVTRDDAGNVIPLSKRFNPADNRITFSLRSGDFASRAAAMFSPFQRTPELRMAIARVAKERAMRLGAEWIEKAAVIRSASSINREVAFREADGFDRRMTAYLDSLTPNARQNLEFEPASLEDDPLISAMLDFGKLMSRSTAIKNGVQNMDEFEGAPWLPPAWYSKGSGITPGKMAKAMHEGADGNGGPLAAGDSAADLWDAVASRIESSRKDKAAYREAVQAFRDAKKTARTEAKTEAEAWGERTKKTAGSPKAQRDMLKAALRTLDGILSAATPEVRARVGGYVKLAGLATDEAMLQEIERRVAKLNVELEKWLKKEYLQRIAKLFKRFAPKKDDKGRITSNITAEAAEDIGFAFDFASLDDANQEKEMGSVEKTLEESEDAAEIQDAIGKLAIFQLFHNLEKRESSELEAAAMWLDELGSGAREARKIIDAARAEQVKAAKDVAKADASNGKLSSLPDAENVEAAAGTWVLKGKARSSTFKRFTNEVKGFLNYALFTMGQQLEIVFGQDSRITTEFHRRAVRAANDSTDIKRDIEARRAAFVADLFGTTSRIKQAGRMGALTVPTASGVIIATGGKAKTIDVPAEIVVRIIEGTADLKALGFTKEEAATLADAWADNEALPVKRQKRVFQIERRSDGKDVELTMSQDAAIQYLLWSNQKASREQMERDGWSKESFQQLNAFLSDDARALAKFFADEYARLGRLIEPVYRRMFHAPFPQVANYSPIFRDISKADSIIDIDQQGHGSGVSSGFILARNKNARSALRRTSAISAFMQHAESAAHWIAHVELVRDLRSVLIDKEVQNAIRSSGRTAAANGIKKRVMQLENQGKVGAAGIAELDSWGSRLLQARAFKGLAWRISPVMKQASAYFNPLLADVPAWDYMRGTARLLSGQLDVSAMWNSPDIQRRIVMGFSAEARIAMDKLGYTGSTLLAAMGKGMLPMQLVDAGWTTAGAAVAFDYYRRNNIKSGMNETLAENAALDQLEMMIAESAQPADPANRSLIEGLQNPWLKSMWMFASESRKTLAVEIMALRRLATGKSKNKAMDVQRAVVAHVIMATTTQLMAGVLSLLMGDDDDREREWSVEEWAAAIAAGPINGLFLFGDAFNYIGRRLFGLHAFEPSTAIGQAVKAVTSAPSILDEAISGEPEEQRKAILKLSEAFGQAASIVGLGNPFTAVDVIIGNPLKDAEKILSRVEE